MKMVSMDSVIFVEIKEENYKIKIFIVYFFNIWNIVLNDIISLFASSI